MTRRRLKLRRRIKSRKSLKGGVGYSSSTIRAAFEDFRNWDYIVRTECKQIGSKSANGIIIQIPFQNEALKAYTVLKCSAKASADSLFFEYYVGKYFINNYLNKLPCFVETYDLYQFNSDESYASFKEQINHCLPLISKQTLL